MIYLPERQVSSYSSTPYPQALSIQFRPMVPTGSISPLQITLIPYSSLILSSDDKRVFVAYWFMVKIPFILTLLIQSILTPYGPFTCAVDKIKSEAGNGRSHWWRDASFLLGDRYCLRKVTLRSPPVVLFAIWGFLRGTVVEVPRAWILLRGRGVLGTGPGSPGNPCFPTMDSSTKKLLPILVSSVPNLWPTNGICWNLG